MAETLPTLIRLAERKVEDATQALQKVRAAREAIRKDKERCAEEAAVAFVNAVGDDDLLSLQAANAFQERIRREVEQLDEADRQLVEQEEMRQEQLREAFGAQKRYEILLERQRLVAAKKKAKKVQAGLDEMGSRKA